MTLTLIKRPRARVPKDHEVAGLLRDSIRELKRPKEFRLGKLVHTEISDGFVIEIYQTGIASFYSRTYSEKPYRHGGQKRKEQSTQKTLESAIAVARNRAITRARFAGRFPIESRVPPRRTRPRRRHLTTATVAQDITPIVEAAIARDVEQELKGTAATCPVCTKIISRDNMALHSHLMAHVRKKLITRQEKKEIQARLSIRRGPRAA